MADVNTAADELDPVRQEYPGWRIWWSSVDHLIHATRDDPDPGQWTFRPVPEVGRMFHVAATTLDRLALKLGWQADIDASLLAAAAVTGGG